VALTVPVRFRQQVASGERRFYLHLQADLTLTLNGSSVQRAGLEGAIGAATNNDRNVQITICSDENVPPAELRSLAEQVKGAGPEVYGCFSDGPHLLNRPAGAGLHFGENHCKMDAG
jgi:biopolymer transport protein ExbD